MQELDAILFDLGNTLVRYYQRSEFPDVLRKCLSNVAVVSGQPDDIGDELFQRALEMNHERDDFRVIPLWTRIQELFTVHACPEEKTDELCRAFLKPIFETAELDETATEVLEELRQRGVRTGIVSNTPWGSPGDAWRTELTRHGLLDRIDAAVFCVDVGWRKPHPAPFRRALELISVSPERTAFVGDDPRWDVAGAEAAGLQSILLSSDCASGARRVIRELRELL